MIREVPIDIYRATVPEIVADVLDRAAVHGRFLRADALSDKEAAVLMDLAEPDFIIQIMELPQLF